MRFNYILSALILRGLLLLTVSFPGLIGLAVAQNEIKQAPKKRGEFYFQWGYNRDWYSKSTIHFLNHSPGYNYDFTFVDAKAHDKPDMTEYWHIDRLTIPQYDLKVGYFFNDRHDLGIELGWNHLKYVVTDGQVFHAHGEINGVYFNQDTVFSPSYIHLQHTNGNNYLLLSLVKRKNLFAYKKIQLSALAKVGAGPMISYTISNMLGNYDPGYFHYHGLVFAAEVGFRISFLKYLFIQSDAQVAFADYTNTRLDYDHSGLSRQTFYSLQWTWEGGVTFPVGKK